MDLIPLFIVCCFIVMAIPTVPLLSLWISVLIYNVKENVKN